MCKGEEMFNGTAFVACESGLTSIFAFKFFSWASTCFSLLLGGQFSSNGYWIPPYLRKPPVYLHPVAPILFGCRVMCMGDVPILSIYPGAVISPLLTLEINYLTFYAGDKEALNPITGWELPTIFGVYFYGLSLCEKSIEVTPLELPPADGSIL